MEAFYVLLADEATCKAMSEALWKLNQPATVAPDLSATPTHYAVGWRKHPTLNQWALEMPPAYQYPRHPDVPMMLQEPGDPYGSQAMMQSLFLPIAANGVASLQALMAYILTSDVIDTGEVLPHVNPALIRTPAQMKAAGWWQ
jgi:hypothetical protein